MLLPERHCGMERAGKGLMEGKMERMERLTERDGFGNAEIIGVDSADLQLNLEFDELNKVTNVLNRLAEYEDLEEQGRIVRLPCAVGDEVYRVSKGAEEPIIPMEVTAVGILSLKAGVGGFLVQVTCRDSNNGTAIPYVNWEFGKSVFFSEEEAEAAYYKRLAEGT